jgi:hypothetical protein
MIKKLVSLILPIALIGTQVINPSIALAYVTDDLYPSSNGLDQTWNVNPGYMAHYVALNDFGNCDYYNDYVFTSTANVRESYYYEISTIPATSTIESIYAFPCAQSINADADLQFFWRLNTDTTGGGDFPSALTIGTTKQEYGASTQYWSGSQPVLTPTSTLEIGFYLPNGGTEVRVHQMRVLVSYH